jgi:GT2 family glycosyltransferase/glycosyltransferase involved in cell wall biosynthesis
MNRATEDVEKADALFREILHAQRSRRDRAGNTSIVVPVYGAPLETLSCLRSIIFSENKSDFRIIVVDDGSPDVQTPEYLDALSAAGVVKLVRHLENRGFPAACNSGIAAADFDDVVLVNSDVEVFGDWLDRLLEHVHRSKNVATVTPLSDDYSFTSYPNPFGTTRGHRLPPHMIDQAARRLGQGTLVEAPTGVGYCMFISRRALDAVGTFDEKAFRRGYGEENDFCQRCLKAGFTNLIAGNVFVHHEGGVSFGPSRAARIALGVETVERLHPGYESQVHEFLARDLLNETRQKIDEILLTDLYPNGARVLISHGMGGGTEVALQADARDLASQGICPLVLRKAKNDPSGYVLTLEHALDSIGDNLGSFDLRTDLNNLQEGLARLGVRGVTVHHLTELSWHAADLLGSFFRDVGLPYEVVLHDYWLVCPRTTMTYESGAFCGGIRPDKCQSCVLTMRTTEETEPPAIVSWHQRADRLLRGAERVLAPSVDTASRFNELGLGGKWVEYRPHALPRVLESQASGGKRELAEESRGIGDEDAPKVIVVLGAVSLEKGAGVLLEVARKALEVDAPIRFEVLGYTAVDEQLSKLKNVKISGKYEQQDLHQLVTRANPDLIWFPAIWPETYSYTVSEALLVASCPMLAFDIGAVGHRVRNEALGWTVPLAHALSSNTALGDLVYFAAPEWRAALEQTRLR